jgi:aspartate aminotransferase-like enzyme
MRNLKLGLALIMVACLSLAASADVVRNVTATQGPDWVKVNIAGASSYSVKHLPPGSADYRSIAIDLHGASIAGGLEPKAALPVNFGLVGQVRVRQIGSTVRVYVDVINWPEYKVINTGSGVQVALKAFKQRRKDPAAMY